MAQLLNHYTGALVAAAFFLGVFFASIVPTIGSPITGFATAFATLNGTVQPIFSPGTSTPILEMIDGAANSLDAELYQFSYAPFQQALAQAAARGVRVRVILEPRVDSNLDTAKFLNSKGIDVRWATRAYANTHSKTLVADGKIVLVGSINWSQHAVNLNRESAVIITSTEIASQFESIFEKDWSDASPFVAS